MKEIAIIILLIFVVWYRFKYKYHKDAHLYYKKKSDAYRDSYFALLETHIGCNESLYDETIDIINKNFDSWL